MYTKQSDAELLELLIKQESLTFQSQVNLQKELIKRKIIENTQDLDDSINKKNQEIKELKYLKDIGFAVEELGQTIKITRTTKAVFMDLIAVVLGSLFCIVGFFGLVSLIGSFYDDNEFSVFGFIINLLMISLGILGIQFLNGLKRLIDYSGFELISKNDIITFKKRTDLKLVEVTKSVSFLDLTKHSDRLFLNLENDEILSANAKSLIQSKTIIELTNKLKTVANTV